jgi:hypothetical protein
MGQCLTSGTDTGEHEPDLEPLFSGQQRQAEHSIGLVTLMPDSLLWRAKISLSLKFKVCTDILLE